MGTISLVFDIEGNGFYEDITNVWCIVTKCVETGEVKKSRPDDIGLALQDLSKADTLIGHNIIDYDLPVLEKLYGFTYTGRIIDTLVFSRLLNPDRFGGHSLASWGIRLEDHKGDFGKDEEDKIDAFQEYSEEMLEYCEQDVSLNYKLYLYLLEEQRRIESA